MSKKRNPRTRSGRQELKRESQAAIAVTVFWMLCALATVSAEAMWGIASVLSKFIESPLLATCGTLGLFIAAVTGACALLVTPVVLKIRQQRPPTAVIWGVVGLASTAIAVAVLS